MPPRPPLAGSSAATTFRLYDKLTLGYLALVPILVLLSGKANSFWPILAFGHPLAILTVWLLVRHQNSLPAILRWFRDWHPVVFFTFFFSEIGHLVNLFFPYWFEPFLLQSDRWLFGMPPWEFFAAESNRTTTEIFAFAYWSYYLLIPFALWLCYTRRRDDDGRKPAISFESAMTRLCLVMYLCYASFLLMPARGPHHAYHLSLAELFTGGWFFGAVLFVQKYGSVVGAAFPSSHVAAAWTVLLVLRRNRKSLFWWLLPLVVLMTASTFVIQYHYVLDAVAGVLLALGIEHLAMKHERRKYRRLRKIARVRRTAARVIHQGTAHVAHVLFRQ